MDITVLELNYFQQYWCQTLRIKIENLELVLKGQYRQPVAAAVNPSKYLGELYSLMFQAELTWNCRELRVYLNYSFVVAIMTLLLWDVLLNDVLCFLYIPNSTNY